MNDIYEMTLDKIKETADHVGGAFDHLMKIWSEGEDRNCVVWVRVQPGMLQHLFVAKEYMNEPHVKALLEREDTWDKEKNLGVENDYVPGS